jgi:hypothetical protein
LTVTVGQALAFGIMSLIFHAFDCGINANREFEDMEALGDRVVLYLAQWDG